MVLVMTKEIKRHAFLDMLRNIDKKFKIEESNWQSDV